MKLKPVLDNLEGLPEAIASLYVARSDGKFVLELDGEIPGFVPKSKHDEFRDNNVKLREQLEQLQSLALTPEDLETFKKLKAEQQANKDKKLIDEGKIEELFNLRTEQMRKDHDAKYNALLAKTSEVEETAVSYKSKLSEVLIDAEVNRGITDVGQVRKGALTDVRNRAKATWKYQDDQLVAFDYQGNQIYGKDGRTPISMEEWCHGLAESAPYLFEGSKGSGSRGSNQSESAGNAKTIQSGDNRGFLSNLEGIANGSVTVV